MALEETGSSSVESAGSESVDTSALSSGGAVDTASVAASVIADMEAGTDAPVKREVAEETPEPEAKPVAEVDPDDFDTVAPETTDALGRKRANSIPHPRVKTMIEKAIAKKTAEWEAAQEPVRNELGQFKARIEKVDAVETIMAAEPERFMQMLAMVNPEYKRFLEAGGKVADLPIVQHDVNDLEPEPDFDLGDGRKTYSMDGLKKLREWDRAQAVKAAEAKVGERFKPFEDQRKAEAERQQQEVAHTEMVGRINKQMETARKWHGFTDHETDILAALKADKGLGLHDAYMQVVIPKLAADRTKIRQELIAEQNKLPSSTSAASTVSAPKVGGAKDTASIAREIMKEFGGG